MNAKKIFLIAFTLTALVNNLKAQRYNNKALSAFLTNKDFTIKNNLNREILRFIVTYDEKNDQFELDNLSGIIDTVQLDKEYDAKESKPKFNGIQINGSNMRISFRGEKTISINDSKYVYDFMVWLTFATLDLNKNFDGDVRLICSPKNPCPNRVFNTIGFGSMVDSKNNAPLKISSDSMLYAIAPFTKPVAQESNQLSATDFGKAIRVTKVLWQYHGDSKWTESMYFTPITFKLLAEGSFFLKGYDLLSDVIKQQATILNMSPYDQATFTHEKSMEKIADVGDFRVVGYKGQMKFNTNDQDILFIPTDAYFYYNKDNELKSIKFYCRNSKIFILGW